MLIGAHESTAGGVSKAFARAEANGGSALQIFTKTARGWAAPELTAEERRAFRAEAKRSGLPAVAHGSYLANLASEDEGILAKTLECVVDELSRCDRLGVPWIVYHPGSHRDLAAGIRRIAASIDEVYRAARPKHAGLCLEVTAGQGNCVGWRFEHLAEILSASAYGDRVGICLDTCHLFAAGYDLRQRRSYERVLAEFDRIVGLQRVKCFHLNDSKRPLGSRVDRHENIGEGALGLAPFRWLVNDPRFERTVGVLETPSPDRYAKTIALLTSLARI